MKKSPQKRRQPVKPSSRKGRPASVVKLYGPKSPVAALAKEPANHRERQQQTLERLLVKAGLKLFAEHGYDGTSIKDIAKAVGISSRTFFRYFPSKEDLLFSGSYDGGKAAIIELKHRPASETVMQAMKGAFMVLSQRCDETREMTLRRVRVIYGSPTLRAAQQYDLVRWEQKYTETIREVRGLPEQESFQIGLQVSIAASIFVAAFDAWQADPQERTMVYWLDEAFHIAEGSFAARPA